MSTKRKFDAAEFGASVGDDSDSSVYSGLEDEDEEEMSASSDNDSWSDVSSDDDQVDSEEDDESVKDEEESKLDNESKDKLDNESKDKLDNESKDEEDDGDLSSEDFFHVASKKEVKEPVLVNEDKVNEYEIDSSDEEDIRNTIGNVPLRWYDDFPHLGYDVEGNQIIRPPRRDEIDEFLAKIDDKDYWRTVKNRMTGETVRLTDEEVDIIQRIQSGRYPSNANQYEDFEDIYSHETMKHPVTNAPPHKRSFLPSMIEKKKVEKIVYAIKMGWIKPKVPKKKGRSFYAIWDKDQDSQRRRTHYISAPKRKLPGHEESYNPPPEYLFNDAEKQEWFSQDRDERKLDFIPEKYDHLRHVPAYSQFIYEAFERCLDLYLCPRQIKMRANVGDPSNLIPQLPKPKDLHPFPSVKALVYIGHERMVRSITVEPQGQFIASGSDDHTVKVWEVLTGRCLRTITVEGIVKSIAWCPNEAVCLLLVAVNDKLLIINPTVGDKIVISNTDSLLESLPEYPENKAVVWTKPTDPQKASGVRLIIEHSKEIKQVIWHAKGDYFASLVPEALAKGIVIHQLSTGQSQVPFQKLIGLPQGISFHPLRPYFLIATQKHIKIYNLVKEQPVKKLITNCQWISSMAVHPRGDNVIIGSYDCRLCWFDVDLSSKPYRTLKHHKKAIRHVAFHKRYPLFASTSDDGSLIICHGTVYNDLLQNPLIVPVKILRGHNTVQNHSVLDCIFHPVRPWVFTSGADNNIVLYT